MGDGSNRGDGRSVGERSNMGDGSNRGDVRSEGERSNMGIIGRWE